MPGGHWLDNLEQTYKEHGLVDVMHPDQPLTPQWIQPWSHLVAWGAEEHLNTLLATCDEEDPKVKTIRSHLSIHREDAGKGLLATYTPTIVSGRKPSSRWISVRGVGVVMPSRITVLGIPLSGSAILILKNVVLHIADTFLANKA